MPIYEYKCWNCGHVFQELQPVTASKEGYPCPKCKSTETTRIPSSFSDLGHGCSNTGDYGGFT